MHRSSNCGVRWGRTDMAKRGIKNPPRPAIAREGAFYSDDDITAIIDATGSGIPPGRRDKLVGRLEQAAERWMLDDAMQHLPTPKMLEKQFAEIERAAANLLEVIGAGPQGALSSIPDPILDRLQLAAAKKATRLGKSGRSLLQESVTGVVQIKRWSAKQVQIEIEREADRNRDSRVSNPRKTTDRALNKWIMEILQIYRDIWGGNTKVYWDPYEKYSQPFHNFVRAANGTRESGTKAAKGVVGRRMSNTALTKAIQRAMKQPDI